MFTYRTYGRTYGRTDIRTDGRTEGRTKPLIEMRWTYLKIWNSCIHQCCSLVTVSSFSLLRKDELITSIFNPVPTLGVTRAPTALNSDFRPTSPSHLSYYLQADYVADVSCQGVPSTARNTNLEMLRTKLLGKLNQAVNLALSPTCSLV